MVSSASSLLGISSKDLRFPPFLLAAASVVFGNDLGNVVALPAVASVVLDADSDNADALSAIAGSLVFPFFERARAVRSLIWPPCKACWSIALASSDIGIDDPPEPRLVEAVGSGLGAFHSSTYIHNSITNKLLLHMKNTNHKKK